MSKIFIRAKPEDSFHKQSAFQSPFFPAG